MVYPNIATESQSEAYEPNSNIARDDVNPNPNPILSAGFNTILTPTLNPNLENLTPNMASNLDLNDADSAMTDAFSLDGGDSDVSPSLPPEFRSDSTDLANHLNDVLSKNENSMVVYTGDQSIIPARTPRPQRPSEPKFVDITHLLSMPQSDACRILKVSPSTSVDKILSKFIS